MVKQLVQTGNDYSLTVVRVVLGLVMFAHGAQKLLGWWGGYGFEGTMGFFTETMGVPYVLALLVILLEFFGALGLVAGVATRPLALGILAIMFVATGAVHWQNGFFMNWAGAQQGEGFEYHLLAAAMSVALIIGGGGAYSVDRLLTSEK